MCAHVCTCVYEMKSPYCCVCARMHICSYVYQRRTHSPLCPSSAQAHKRWNAGIDKYASSTDPSISLIKPNEQ